jgi:hypothetical protein
MQTEVHNQKWYLEEDHDIKKYDQEITWLFLCQLLFWYKEWNEQYLLNDPPLPKWNYKN